MSVSALAARFGGGDKKTSSDSSSKPAAKGTEEKVPIWAKYLARKTIDVAGNAEVSPSLKLLYLHIFRHRIR